MAQGLRDHPLRHVLANEVHARPFVALTAPQRASHLAMLSGEGAAEADRAQVAVLCQRFDVPPPGQDESYLMVDLGAFRLRWERHTEFSTYTFLTAAETPGFDREAAPFAAPVIDLVPRDWLCGLPGELLVGIHVEMVPRAAAEPDLEAFVRLFDTENFAASLVSGAAATVAMDFAVRKDGFGRIVVHDRQLRPRQGGRLVQRLLEIETYRIMALLALPLARRHGRTLSLAGERLTACTSRMAVIEGLDDEQHLLADLTRLSAEIEDVAAAASYRFAAARAYYALVRRRVEELREARVEGQQTIGEFLERRLAPAMRTCDAVASRIEDLSARVSRASQLLRTRVEIQLEAQNLGILRSMNRRARLQLRLQQTVEGLSVAAISYYLVGLVSYAAKGVNASGLALDVDLVTAVSIPIVVTLVGYGVIRLRRTLGREARPPPEH